MLRVLTAATIFVALLLPAGAHAQDPDPGHTIWLDAYSPDNDGDAGPIANPVPLGKDVYYLIRITGTFSAFGPGLWGPSRKKDCGKPDTTPMFPTEGAEQRPVGQDAEFAYGTPRTRRFCPNLPMRYALYFDIGLGWYDYDPIDGRPSAPLADHTYEYLIEGRGDPLLIRLADSRTDDNNGLFRITVRRAVKSECRGIQECENHSTDAPPPPPPPTPEIPAPGTEPYAPPGSDGNGGGGTAPGGGGTTPGGPLQQCRGPKRYRLRIDSPPYAPIKRVRVVLDGKKQWAKRKKTKKGKRYFVARIDLSTHGRSVVRVRLVKRITDGRVLRGEKWVRVCMGKKKSVRKRNLS